jgi:hypothetical protein
MATVRKRGNTFTITVSLGYKEDGTHVRKFTTFKPPPNVTPGKAEKLAKEYAAIFEDKIRGYTDLDENRTLKQLADWYYDTVAPNTLKPNILISYRQGIESHVIPRIGREKLKNITPQMLDGIFRELQMSGNLEQQYRLKSASLFDGILNAASAALGTAQRSGIPRPSTAAPFTSAITNSRARSGAKRPTSTRKRSSGCSCRRSISCSPTRTRLSPTSRC